MGKRLSMLLVLVVAFLTVFAFTAGSGLAQTTGTSTAGSGTTAPAATRVATTAPSATVAATTAATTAPSATRATTGSAVATGTGGGTTGGSGAVATGTGGGTTTTTTTLPATGQARSGSTNFLIIEAIVLALAVIGTGVALKRRAPRA